MSDIETTTDAEAARPLTVARLQRRVERIKAKGDPKRQRKDMNRLAVKIVLEIAAGRVKKTDEMVKVFSDAHASMALQGSDQ